jgi:hypothetical protein
MGIFYGATREFQQNLARNRILIIALKKRYGRAGPEAVIGARLKVCK